MLRWVFLLMLAGLMGACGAPGERKSVVAISDEDLAAIGSAAFEQLKAKTRLSADYADYSISRCVADQLNAVLSAPDERIDVAIFEASTINAFALPGGKLGLHSGVLQVANSDALLAALLSHEIAHLLAGHAGQRLSSAFSVEAAVAAVQSFRGEQGPQSSRAVFALLGLGVQVGIPLAYTPEQEAQADRASLELMAAAGFAPEQALQLWQRLESHADAPWLASHLPPARHLPTLRAALQEIDPVSHTAKGCR